MADKKTAERWAGYSPGVRSILFSIEAYCEKMAPGKRLTDDQVNVLQKGLFGNLESILTLPEHKDFSEAFLGALELFNQYRDGALGTNYVSRNYYSIPLSTEKRRMFASWTNIFVILANVKLRKVLSKQTDINRAYTGLPEQYRERAVAFVKALLGQQQ